MVIPAGDAMAAALRRQNEVDLAHLVQPAMAVRAPHASSHFMASPMGNPPPCHSRQTSLYNPAVAQALNARGAQRRGAGDDIP